MGIFAFGLERVGLICTRIPRVSLALLLLVTAATLFGALQITFDDELRLMFSSNAERYKTYERFSSKFPSVENQFVLLVESNKPLGKPGLEIIRNLHLDMQFIDGITGVVSMFSARNPPDGEGVARPILPALLPSGDQLTKALRHVRTHPLVGERLLSKDGRSAVIIISFKQGVRDFAGLSGLINGLNQLVAPAAKTTGLQMTLTGEPALRFEILKTIRQDFYFLNALGAIIAISICFLFFRQPRLVFITSLPPMIGVMWTLGGFGLLQQPITAINNVLPTLVLVIGFSDALHMMQTIRQKMAQGISAKQAAVSAVVEVGPACALTSITTMIACLSLTFSSSYAVAEFGIAACMAIFAAFLAIIMFIPTLTILLLPKMEGDQTALSENKITHLVNKFCDRIWMMVQRRYVFVAVVSLPLLVITGVLYFVTQTTYDYREYLSASSPANLAIDRFNAKLGGAASLHIMIESKPGVQPLADSFKIVREVQKIVQAQGSFRNVFSIVSAKDWAQKDGANNSDFLDTIPKHYRERLVSASKKDWLITAYFPSTPAPETRSRINNLNAMIEPLRQRFSGYKIEPAGITPLTAFASEQLIEGLKKSLGLAVIITMCVIAIAVGSVILPVLSTAPNLLALTIVGALLFLLGSRFQITSVLALTIAFGIAVDNTIHLLNRFRLERRQLGIGPSLRATIAKTGPVLIVATLVLSCGLMATQLSDLPMVQLFGLLCIVVISSALVATLLILPALILAASKRFENL